MNFLLALIRALWLAWWDRLWDRITGPSGVWKIDGAVEEPQKTVHLVDRPIVFNGGRE